MGSDTYSSGSVFLSSTKKLSGRGMLMMCSLNLSVIEFFTPVGDWVFTYLYPILDAITSGIGSMSFWFMFGYVPTYPCVLQMVGIQ